jgi:hypothetical protein
MMTKSIDDDLLALMIKHEESISGLYDEFRKAIPGMEAFWRQLVQDEKAHAQVLRDLAARLVRKDVLLTNRPFPREAILAAITYIIRKTGEITQAGASQTQALATAIDLERAMLEKNFFSVIESDSTDMKKEFEAIRTHTEEHAGRLYKALLATKSAG